MNTLTFGRYAPYSTITHKIDPRTKIILTILIMVGIFFKFQLWSTTLIMSVLYLILLFIGMLISKVSFFDLFNSLKGMWLLIILLFAAYIFIPSTAPEGGVAFSIKSFNVYWSSIYMGIYIFIRLILMLGLMMTLTTTTKPMDLTYAFEWFMYPLKFIHFPVHEIAMTLSIALRFIPTLLEETDRIMKAQASRGVDFEKGGLFKRFKAIISLIIPLFVSAIDRSEQLSDAMEVRGYNPRAKRTKYRHLKFGWLDLFSFVFIGALFAGIVWFYVYDKTNNIDLLKVFSF